MHKNRWIMFSLLLFFLFGCNFPLLAVQETQQPTLTQELQSTGVITPSAEPTIIPTENSTIQPAEAIVIGNAWLRYGAQAEALQTFQEEYATTDNPHDRSDALLGIGRTYYAQGDCANAEQAFNLLVDQFPESDNGATAFYLSGQCAMQAGDYLSAAQLFQRYLELQPGKLDAYIYELKGDAYLAAQDSPSAIAAYEAALASPGVKNPATLRLNIARAYTAMGDTTNALRLYQQAYETSSDDYQRAQANLLMGQIYLSLDMPEQAYARFNDSVENFPRAYDTYSGLVTLVENNQPVNELNRGLVDYFAGQYLLAMDAFTRYLADTPEHDGTAHYYRGLSLYMMAIPDGTTSSLDTPESVDLLNQAIEEWRTLIHDHPGDRWYAAAYDEISYTQWFGLDQYPEGAQTLLDFVAALPTAPEAPGYLFQAARIYERNDQLDDAAATWERVFNEYPSSDSAYRALFLAGITRYRQGNLAAAMTLFQRVLVLGTQPEDRASASLWVGKVFDAQGDYGQAREWYQRAALEDPTGYYSERAQDILDGRKPYTTSATINLGYDLNQERPEAEAWLRKRFQIADDVSLDGIGDLATNEYYLRGMAFLKLDELDLARTEFETLRQIVQYDPVQTYRLMNSMVDLGLYRSAILASRQILTLAGLSDAGTLDAPVFFNHIRFGVYYRELVLPTAKDEGISELVLLSLIRQESLFDGAITSAAGARGLMQLMPATAAEVAANMGYPDNYTANDLYRPLVNIRLGARYLSRQVNYLGGDYMAATAGYNGGPGNAAIWQELAKGDPDLFVECIRFDETRQYVMRIYENFEIYRKIYELP
jgi:soluble lytic murein transglycosylase